MASPVWTRRRRRQQLRTVLRRVARHVELERRWNGHDPDRVAQREPGRRDLLSTREWLREPLRPRVLRS